MNRLKSIHHQRDGASAILNLFMFGVLLVFAFMNLNLANIQRHRVSSQVSCDFASRFGADLVARDTDSETVNEIANEMVRSHTFQGADHSDMDIDVEIGSAVPKNGKLTFQKNVKPFNAVRVSTNYKVPLFGIGPAVTLPIVNTSTSAIMERDVCLVIDRSGSMNWDLDSASWIYEYYWSGFHSKNYLGQRYRTNSNARYWWHYRPHPTRSRWSSMIPAVYGLADELSKTKQEENFSIVSFSTAGSVNWYDNNWDLRVKRYSRNAADVEVDLTKDYRWAAQKFDDIYADQKLVSGGTDISAGIDAAKDLLVNKGRSFAFKTIIVMTDGQYNGSRAPWLASAEAAAEGIEVYAVTFSRHADKSAMVRTAEEGNGEHFHAPDGDSLEEIFRKIANIPPKVRIE